MAQESLNKAMADARIKYNDIQQAAVGYVYGQFRFQVRQKCGFQALLLDLQEHLRQTVKKPGLKILQN